MVNHKPPSQLAPASFFELLTENLREWLKWLEWLMVVEIAFAAGCRVMKKKTFGYSTNNHLQKKSSKNANFKSHFLKTYSCTRILIFT